MIKNIFIPERIGSYFVFSKRIVSVDIGLTELHATVVLAHGNTRTIEKLIEERIEVKNTLSHDEAIIKALVSLRSKIGKYDELCCVLSSSQVIFKELTLPFTGAKKIKMVVPFEVESLLPFSLDQAVIDSIITHEDTETKQTTIFVAAVKNEIIEQYTHYFEAAGLQLNKISVDMFELFSLYKLVGKPVDAQKTEALIDLGYHVTRIGLIIDGQLKYIRVLPKGLLSIAKKLASNSSQDVAEKAQQLLRSGVEEDSAFAQEAKAALDELFSEIQFTISSFTQKLKKPLALHKVVIVGALVDMPGLAEALKQAFNVEIQLLQPKQLIHHALFQSKVTTLPNDFAVSIASALSTELTKDFNLQKQAAEKQDARVITDQLIALAALALLTFISFSLYSFLRVRSLRRARQAASTEAINELKKSFKLKPQQMLNLDAANKAAFNELRMQESAWHRLSAENRYAFLRNLTELSRCISLKEAQLELSTLIIKADSVKLYGSVPGYRQLTTLQNQLECPMFKKLPKLQDWNFKSEPITLTINRKEL